MLTVGPSSMLRPKARTCWAMARPWRSTRSASQVAAIATPAGKAVVPKLPFLPLVSMAQ